MKTKIENRLQALYAEKGYNLSTDNRCPYTKSINQALATGQLKIELCKSGYYWTRKKDGFKYRMRIIVSDIARIYFFKGEPTPEYICDCIGHLITKNDIRSHITIHNDAYECDKCNGKGHIIAFSHVCQGVCFSCLGLGYRFHSGNW